MYMAKTWNDWMAEGFPELERGMIVFIHRPWTWRHPFQSALAYAIRKFTQKLTGSPARFTHCLLYIGNGRAWSQDTSFDVTDLKKYKGCTLVFYRNANFNPHQRNHIVAEAGVYRGQRYGYLDILGFALGAILGYSQPAPAFLSSSRWICSEAVIELIRKAQPTFLTWITTLITPQELHQQLNNLCWEGIEVKLS